MYYYFSAVSQLHLSHPSLVISHSFLFISSISSLVDSYVLLIFIVVPISFVFLYIRFCSQRLLPTVFPPKLFVLLLILCNSSFVFPYSAYLTFIKFIRRFTCIVISCYHFYFLIKFPLFCHPSILFQPFTIFSHLLLVLFCPLFIAIQPFKSSCKSCIFLFIPFYVVFLVFKLLLTFYLIVVITMKQFESILSPLYILTSSIDVCFLLLVVCGRFVYIQLRLVQITNYLPKNLCN